MSLVLADERRIPIGKAIVAGFKAPWMHAGGLLKCSALWLAAEFLYLLEVSRHSAWHENAEGKVVWDYEPTGYGTVIFAVRLFALMGFFVSWSRGLYFDNGGREFRLWRYERRLWWLLRDGCKLLFGLAFVALLFTTAFWIVSAIIWSRGIFALIVGSILSVGLLIVLAGIACRLATFFTAIAVEGEPRPVVDAAEPTRGFGFRIFLVLMPLLTAWFAIYTICFGDGSFFNIWIPGAPFWPLAIPERMPPFWAIGLATAVDGVFLASLFATLVELYRYITPRSQDDAALRLF